MWPRPLGSWALCLLLLATLAASQEQVVDTEELEAKALRLRNSLAADPASFMKLLKLAAALQQLDYVAPDGGKRVPEAEALYRRALDVAPNKGSSMVVHGNLGALLLAAGRLEEAAEAMQASLGIAEAAGAEGSESALGTLFNLAKVRQQQGREAEAEALAEAVLARGRSMQVAPGPYLKAWALLRRPTAAQVATMEEAGKYLRLRRKGVDEAKLSPGKRAWWQQQAGTWNWLDSLPTPETAWLFYALHKAHDRAGDHAKAWAHLATANRLQAAPGAYSPAREEGLLAALASTFQAPIPGSNDPAQVFWARLLRGDAGVSGAAGAAPIFVVGLPRSGSTLVEQILASHSRVWGAGEDTELAPLVPSMVRILQGGGEVSGKDISDLGRQYVDRMRARMPAELRGNASSRFVDKMLRNAWNIGFIQLMLPRACIVHTARHPADTALSIFAQPFEGRGTPFANSLESIAHQVNVTGRLMAQWDALLPPRRILHLRYEDLVADLEGTARTLLAHCGLPWEAGVLDFHTNARQVATASVAQVRQALYVTSVGRWRSYAAGLKPLLRTLRQAILDYEGGGARQTRVEGQPSTAALLEELLGGGGGGEEDKGKRKKEGKDGRAAERVRDEL